MADLSEKELDTATACCGAVFEKEKDAEPGPAHLIAETAQRLIDEVKRRRAGACNIQVKATTHFDSQNAQFDYPVVQLTIDGVGFETRPLTSPALAERIAAEVATALGVEVRR